MGHVRSLVRERLFDQRFVVTGSGAIIRAGAYPTAPIVRGASVGLSLPGHPVIGKAHKGNATWARIKLPSSVTAYIWSGMGHFEAV